MSGAEPAARCFASCGFEGDHEGADACVPDGLRGRCDRVAVEQTAHTFKHAQALPPRREAHPGFSGKEPLQCANADSCGMGQRGQCVTPGGIAHEALCDAQRSGIARHGQHEGCGGRGCNQLCDEAGQRRARRENAAPHGFKDGLVKQRRYVDGVGLPGSFRERCVQVEHAKTHGAAHAETARDFGRDPECTTRRNVPETFADGALDGERAFCRVDELGPLRGLGRQHGGDTRGDGEGSETERGLTLSRHFFAEYRLFT